MNTPLTSSSESVRSRVATVPLPESGSAASTAEGELFESGPTKGEQDAADAAAKVVVMPGTASTVSAQIHAVSPEGAPGDAKLGPRGVRMIMLAAGLVIIVAAMISSIWIGWIGAAVMVAFGVVAMLFNPVMGAAAGRANDRAEVLEHRAGAR
jgi:hypothetical protein